MRELSIAYGASRQAKRWVNGTITFDALKDRLREPVRTAETAEEYPQMSKSERDSVKDHGGFVAGVLLGGKRTADAVESRSMVVLDADRISRDLIDSFEEKLPYASCLYTTHSSTPKQPRARIVIPASRDMTPDEYAAVARNIAMRLGIEQFDQCSYRPNQMMYWPSCPSDGEFIFKETSKEWLDPDTVLAALPEWNDPTSLPISARETRSFNSSKSKAADPLAKEGIVGAFNNAYFPVTRALEEFLGDVYEPTDMPDRWQLKHSSSIAGVVIYDDRFVYSHHSTDPACNKLCSAFDIVRIHLFKDMDDSASFKAMRELASNDNNVKAALLAMKQGDEATEFESWKAELEYNINGKIDNSVHNSRLILENDDKLQSIAFNELADTIEIRGSVPWKHPSKFWRDVDDDQLMCYVEEKYGSFTANTLRTAVSKVADDRSYHPIKEYFASLPDWDGTPRIDTMLIDYFGSDDTLYVRAVSRKILCGAVKRIYEPGIKFDHIVVLNGPQGIGKSTFISKLGMEWFSDSLSISDMNDKTAAEKLQGYWILEIGELAGMRKMDIDKVKAFISRQDDKYRAAYGRHVTPHLRQCIFFGTTNADTGYLRDITGNRRFWTVRTPGTGKIKPWDLDKTTVDQMWAEALFLVDNGEELFLPAELEECARDEQSSAMERDDREGLVIDYLEMLLPENWYTFDLYKRRDYFYNRNDMKQANGGLKRQYVSNTEIWCECFGKEKSDLTRAFSFEISAIMARIGGWERSNKTKWQSLYGKQRIYLRKDHSDTDPSISEQEQLKLLFVPDIVPP